MNKQTSSSAKSNTWTWAEHSIHHIPHFDQLVYTATQPIFCLFGSPPTAPPPPGAALTGPLAETSTSAGLAPPLPLLPSGSGRFIVGGRYCPRLAMGLPGPTGAPMRLAWLS